MIRLALLSAMALVALTAPADAGPLAGGLGVIGTALSGTLGKVLLTGASVAAQVFLGRQQKPPKPDPLTRTVEGEEGEGYIAVGRMLVGGKRVFGGSKSVWTYRVIAHAIGLLIAIEEFFYGGQPIIVEGYEGADDSKYVSSPPYATKTDYKSFLRIQTRFGLPNQAAFGRLIDAFPTQWAEDHRGRGIAVSLITLISPGQGDEAQQEKFSKVVGNGIKDFQILGRWQEPYDPRLEANAWTVNGALVARWAREKLPGHAEDEEFDDDALALMADEAELEVPTIRPIDWDARVEIIDDEGENTSDGGATVSGTCVAEYDYAYRVFSWTGESTSNVHPLYSFDGVLEPGIPTKLKLTLSRDTELFNSVRFGSVAPTVTRDEAGTYEGDDVRILEFEGTPDGEGLHLRFNGSATGDEGQVKIDWLEIQLFDVRPRSVASGGAEGPIDTDWVQALYDSVGIEEVENDAGQIAYRWIWDFESEFTLEPDDILDTDIQWSPDGPELPNSVYLRYLEPRRQYGMTELPLDSTDHITRSQSGPAWANDEAMRAIYGKRENKFELPFCPDPIQACEAGRVLHGLDRAPFGTIVTRLPGLLAFGRRVFTAHLHPRVPGGAVRVVRCYAYDPPTYDSTSNSVTIPVKVIPDDLLDVPFDPEVHGCLPAPKMPVPPFAAELTKPDPPFSACWIKYQPGGDMSGAYEFRLRFSPNGVEPVEGTDGGGPAQAEATFRTYTAGEPDLWRSMEETYSDRGAAVETMRFGWRQFDPADPEDRDLRGEALDTRVRFFDTKDNPSDNSNIFEVAALAVDNTEPDPPTGTVIPNFDDGEGGTFTTAPTVDIQIAVERNISAVRCVVEMASPPLGTSYAVLAEVDVRPDDVFEVVDVNVSTPGTYNIRARTETTDGTASDWWETTHTTDDPETP